jgi:hypothetical protein
MNFLDGPGWEDQLVEISTPALESLKFSGSVSLLRNLDITKVPSLRAIALQSNEPSKPQILASCQAVH